MRSRFMFVAAVVLGLMSLALPGQANHRWGKYHWKGTGVRTIHLIDSVTNTYDSNLNTAASEWSNPIGGFVKKIDAVIDGGGDSSTGTRSTCPAASGKVRVCNYEYGTTGWLGVAQIWIYRGGDGHIAQGTVEINDTYMTSSPYNANGYPQFVMCQEVGHTFGLDHQDTTQHNVNLGSCMDYTHDPDGSEAWRGGLSNEHPNAHDFEELAIIYSHDDGAKKGGPPFGGGAAPSSSRSVRVRQQGQYTVVTFILWA